MTYSSAIFGHENLSLHDAQIAKYEKIISSAGVNAGEHLLEIGCGWGGLMETAISNNIDIEALNRGKVLRKTYRTSEVLQEFRASEWSKIDL